MAKSDILSSLNYNKNQLSTYKEDLNELKEKMCALQEFSKKCDLHVNSFDSSMVKRKKRLSVFDCLTDRVKTAARYKQKMSDMLNGSEYSSTVASIDSLQNSIAAEKRNVSNDIQYTEEQIALLEVRIAELQYEYDNYPEEVETDES